MTKSTLFYGSFPSFKTENLASYQITPSQAKWTVCHSTPAWGFWHQARLGMADSSGFPSADQKKGVSMCRFLSIPWHLSYCSLLARAVLCAINIWLVPLWKCTQHYGLLRVLEFPASAPIAETSLRSLGDGLQTLTKLTVLSMLPSSMGGGQGR